MTTVLVLDSEDVELRSRLLKICEEFQSLCYSPNPKAIVNDTQTEMSADQINKKCNSLIGLAGEILDLPPQEQLDEVEMFTILTKLEKGESLEKLRDIYGRKKNTKNPA